MSLLLLFNQPSNQVINVTMEDNGICADTNLHTVVYSNMLSDSVSVLDNYSTSNIFNISLNNNNGILDIFDIQQIYITILINDANILDNYSVTTAYNIRYLDNFIVSDTIFNFVILNSSITDTNNIIDVFVENIIVKLLKIYLAAIQFRLSVIDSELYLPSSGDVEWNSPSTYQTTLVSPKILVDKFEVTSALNNIT